MGEPRPPFTAVPESVKDQMLELYDRGVPIRAIGKELHISHATLYRTLDERGVRRRDPIKSEKMALRSAKICRNGHARNVWGHKNADGIWRCRRCQGQHGFVYILGQVADSGEVETYAVCSTRQLAERAAPDGLVWDGGQPVWYAFDGEAGGWEIRMIEMDVGDDNG